MSLLSRAAPRWFTIPAHRPFLADLAAGVRDALAEGGPEAAHDAVLLLPTRRAARALARAFADASTGPVLLPQIRAIGDLEEDEPPFEPGDLASDLPPAISAHRRRFELARLISENESLLGQSLGPAGALEYGAALGAFLDGLQLEEKQGLALDRIDDLGGVELAEHWRRSADVLKLALVAWPRRLAELGVMDIAERRVALLRRLADQWRDRPPEGLVVAAGSTGTTPANADLLAAVARAPRGAVVLPGLDLELGDDAWAQVDEPHPQGALKRLLANAEVERAAVAPWPYSGPVTEGRWRRRVINEALRPPDATADWLAVIRALQAEHPDAIAEGLAGLCLLRARNEEEAADLIAVLLRETLESPGRTVALVTPDQALARRVSARLSRWGLAADSTAGLPLSRHPTGVLMGLVCRWAADPSDPVALLAILKHPMVRLGLEPAEFRRAAEALERHALRGPRLENWAAIERKLREGLKGERAPSTAKAERVDAAQTLIPIVRDALAPASEAAGSGLASPSHHAAALAKALEGLAADDEGDLGRLWAGSGGEAAGRLLAGLIEDGVALPLADGAAFAELLARLLDGEMVRTDGAAHPRLQILGALEARLVSADRMILAGLEEGVWPRPAPTDPFLSRPMRKALELPPPERRLGLSAHDFAQAASAPEVFLIHAERRENAPAVQSRWLWRLQTLARGAGVALPSRPELFDWIAALDAPGRYKPAPRPKPTPPLAVRPTRLSVTRVETWVRDPYATYARYILGLTELDRPDAPVEARARGTAIHAALERFCELHPGACPEDADRILAALVDEELERARMPGHAMTRERAIAARFAPAFAAFEARRRRRGLRLLIEQSGELAVMVDGEPFTVTAKADRIELDGGYAHVLDYKTGGAPTKKQVEAGLAPQLTLTAAILARGGFAGTGAVEPGDLAYVRVKGGKEPLDEVMVARAGDSAVLADEAIEGLARRVARFRDPATAYTSKAAPQFVGESGDYDHLARVWEWHVIGGGDEDAG